MSRAKNPRLNGRLLPITARHGAWLRSQPEYLRNGIVVRGLQRIVALDEAPRDSDDPLVDSVFVRMSDELAGSVAVYAELAGVSMNQLVRTAIDLEMNR